MEIFKTKQHLIKLFVYCIMKNEIWKPIRGYEGVYEVSSLGRVRSLDRYVKHYTGVLRKLKGKYLATTISNGYLSTGLTKNGKTKTHNIHRLMGVSFIPNPENKRCINHIDGNKLNNSLENLEWTTDKENLNHAWDNGLCENVRNASRKRKGVWKNTHASKKVVDENGHIYPSVVVAADSCGINYSTLVSKLNGRLKNNTGLKYDN